MKSPLNCFKFIYVMFVIFDILMYDNATIIRIAISINITANIIKQTNVHMKSTKDIMTRILTERNQNTIKPALMGTSTGADPGFQVRGGAYLKKLRRAEAGAKNVGAFRVKNHDFTPKNLIFSNFRRGGARWMRPSPWIRPCCLHK